jgi:methylenetetrahydrofolate dehydrogenase (NADP+) / methenyltetrahydrofolate cyclohydrolase
VSARPLAGRDAAAALRGVAAEAVRRVGAVTLAVVKATDDESAVWYVRSLVAAAAKVGISCDVTDLGVTARAAQITATLRTLSADAAVHGIILQTPLPPGLRLAELATGIVPVKDVDGANPLSLGRLTAGLPAFAPATAEAVLRLLDFHGVELAGRRAVVVGRSVVVGKPLSQLLLARDATVTVCHSRTPDLPAVTREADVLVVSAGRPSLITARYVRPGAVVVDVGTNPTAAGSLVGDVDAVGVAGVAGALSPVPGGVGTVTTAQLLFNTASAAVGITASAGGPSTAELA